MWFEWWEIMIGLGLIVVGAVGMYVILLLAFAKAMRW
jgi:preprotein translocase subunit Sss1